MRIKAPNLIHSFGKDENSNESRRGRVTNFEQTNFERTNFDNFTSKLSSNTDLDQYFLKSFFFGVPHLATCIFLFFYNGAELGVEIDPGMSMALFEVSHHSPRQIRVQNLALKILFFFSLFQIVKYGLKNEPFAFLQHYLRNHLETKKSMAHN